MSCLKKHFILLFLSFSFLSQAQHQFEFNLIWEQDVFPNNPYRIQFDELQRPYFYVANDNGGVRIFKNEANSDPIQIDQLFPANWGFLKVMDITQQGNYLYLALGSIFDLFAQDFGIAIINIENPEAAFVTDYWRKAVPQEGAAIIKVSGNYAFLGAMGAGLHILDISNPNQIDTVSSIVPDVNFPIPNPNFIEEPNARGMALKDEFVFLCNDAGGIRVIDISTIEIPEEANRYINSDFVGIAPQAYNNIILHEELGYIATDYCGLEIIDISDPMDISQVGIWNPWNCDSTSNYWQNSMGHTNQLRFLPGYEGEILIVNGNETDLIALDVSEPANPLVLDIFGDTNDSIRTWGIGISETQIAAAYYTSNAPWISKESKIKLFDWNLTTTSTNELPISEIQIFPNPSRGDLTVSTGTREEKSASVRLIDILGSEVFTKEIEIHEGSFNLELFAYHLAGIYFLQTKIGEQYLVTKVVFD